jgi:hypothetical protein
MDESADEIPVLSIGSVNGNGIGTYEWRVAMRPLAARIRQLRDGVDSPLHVNVVYFVPGPAFRPDFEGVRTGSYLKAQHALVVQVALPIAPAVPHQQILRALLLDAIDAAEEFARRRKIAEELSGLRDLARTI